jgi:putative hydrolase
MSVLEGHADVVMDSVGPQVIPTWAKIRRDFSARRRRTGFASIIGKLFGLDAKLAQYANGAAFCKAVIDTAGMDTLNRVFNSAADMPTLSELHDPDAWLARQQNHKPRRALTDEHAG